MRACFELKSLGTLRRYLGLDFNISENSISLNQETYISSMLQRFGKEICQPMPTPIPAGNRLTKRHKWSSADGAKPPYGELIGCLLYLARGTRQDIAHALCMLGQFNDCFGKVKGALERSQEIATLLQRDLRSGDHLPRRR